MRLLFLFITTFLLLHTSRAQPVAGLWKGSFRSGTAPFVQEYRYELLLFQNGNNLSGYSYSALGNFEAVCEVTGTVYPAYLVVRETKTLFQSLATPGQRQQHLLFFDDEAMPRVLSGDWQHINKTAGVPATQKGTSFLRRLEDASASALLPHLQKNGIIATQPATPAAATPTIRTDSLRMASRPISRTDTLRITGRHIRLTLFDEGVPDGDRISLYANGRLLLQNELLGTEAVTVVLDWPDDVREVELVFFAENEGSIPPNTGLLRVEAGDKRYELRFSSSLRNSAAVVLVQQ